MILPQPPLELLLPLEPLEPPLPLVPLLPLLPLVQSPPSVQLTVLVSPADPVLVVVEVREVKLGGESSPLPLPRQGV